MSENKTKATEVNVSEFILKVDNDIKRKDSFALVALFKTISGCEPKMWGPTIIDFGSYHYKYESGHQGEAPLTGFSPRKDSIVLYLSPDIEDREQWLEKLGKHKSGKACVYVKKLEDINLTVLEDLIRASIESTLLKYPNN